MSNIFVTNQPSEQQLEHIFQLLEAVFPVERAYFEDRLKLDTSYDPATTWFASVDGEVASTTQIFPLQLRVGSTVIKVGGMGSVGTDPKFRGMGLAHKVLLAQSEWMKETDYDLSVLLASKHAFYEKAGWHLIPESIYWIPTPSVINTESDSYEIIPFETQYLAELKSIYEQFNKNRTYTLVRDDTYWTELLHWPAWYYSNCLLLRKNDKIVAYGLIDKANGEHAILNELMYLPEAEDGVIALFQALCALRQNTTHIIARLTKDHKLYEYCMEHHGTHHEQRMAMWKMIDINRLFNKLRPELEVRIQQSHYGSKTLHVILNSGQSSLLLQYNHDQESKLTIIPYTQEAEANEAITITLDETSLIAAIMFGYDKIASVNSNLESYSNLEQEIIETLFPNQEAVFYWTDRY